MKNRSEVMKQAEALAKRDYPESTVEWVQKPKQVKYPTGVTGWLGKIRQSAPGYRTRERIVDAGSGGLWIR
jgi:hypothetical protein